MHKYRLAEISKITPTVCVLTLEKVSGGDFGFAPGQYAALHFRRNGRRTPVRCFSIVSSPRQSDRLQFAAKMTGDFTFALSELEAGEDVYVQGPFGDFVMDSDDTSLVLMAGGIGITPYVSMLRYLAESKSTLPVTLVYSYKNAGDAAFLDQLESFARSNPNFKLVKSQGRFKAGMVDKIVAESAADATYFLCGPPGFMDVVSRELKQQGVDDYQLVMEAFGQRGAGSPQISDQDTKKVYRLSALGIAFGFAIFATGNLLSSGRVAAEVREATSASDDSSSGTSTQTTTPTDTSQNTNGGSTYSAPTTTQTYQSPMSTVS